MDKSKTLTPRHKTPEFAEHVPTHLVRRTSIGGSKSTQLVRRTSSGCTQSTPKRLASVKGKKNLVPGAGTKKIKIIEDIRNLKTKKATERTKNMIQKHTKEAAENLLKVNDTKVNQ